MTSFERKPDATKLYVAGPMSGHPKFNFPAFAEATAALRDQGYDVVSPAELDEGVGTDEPWDFYLRRDLALLVECDGVATLPGWRDSKGATLEVHVAKSLGMDVLTVYGWLGHLSTRLIVGLSGVAGSGKDTAAQALFPLGVRRLAFADVLKNVAAGIGWDGKKDEAGRKLLQDLGVEARKHLGEDVWVQPVRRRIEESPSQSFVITDMRFPNEAEMIRDLGGTLVRIEREGYEPANNHVSDTALDDFDFDLVIANDGDISYLHTLLVEGLGL